MDSGSREKLGVDGNSIHRHTGVSLCLGLLSKWGQAGDDG